MIITNQIEYVGVSDKTLDLFESQYKIPNGISYNSYIIQDEKIAIMDTVDKRVVNEWIQNIEQTLKQKQASYLVVSHLEPDHSAGIEQLAKKYPNMQIVLSPKAQNMLPQFVSSDLINRCMIVKEGEILDLGTHKLQFIMAPMVHWPEVMFTYEQTQKVLFSADGFGKFGTIDAKEDWLEEARRYYINIVGKYGTQVQAVLKKVENLPIEIICPLHGTILKENLGYYIEKYNQWSSYIPEETGILIAYNSIHGNTQKAVEKLVEMLKQNQVKNIQVSDLARKDMSQVVADAFQYDRLIIAAPTYDAGLFPMTEDFIRHLKHKNYQNRNIGIIENGSWAPMAAKCIQDIIKDMKKLTICEPVITIKTKMEEETIEKMQELAKTMAKIGGEKNEI